MKDVILVAASGLAREVMATISEDSSLRVVGLLDDEADLIGTVVGGSPVLGRIDEAPTYPQSKFIVCAGSGRSRSSIVDRLASMGIGRDRFVSVIHPSVSIPASCRIGLGAVLLAQVVLTVDVTVGDHVVVMPGAVLTHDTVVDDFATLCSGVMLGGGVHIATAAYLGMGSSVRERVSVGELGVLGMGATLLEDLPSNEVWIGVPAQPIRSSKTGIARQDNLRGCIEGEVPV